MAEKTAASEETYTASEAAKIRSITYTSVINAKEKLAAAGVDISGKGKDWRIPASVLDVLPLPRAASARANRDDSNGRDILAIQEEFAAVEEILAEKKAEVADLSSRSKALKKELDSAKRSAVKEAEQELAAATARMAAIKELVGSEG